MIASFHCLILCLHLLVLRSFGEESWEGWLVHLSVLFLRYRYSIIRRATGSRILATTADSILLNQVGLLRSWYSHPLDLLARVECRRPENRLGTRALNLQITTIHHSKDELVFALGASEIRENCIFHKLVLKCSGLLTFVFLLA